MPSSIILVIYAASSTITNEISEGVHTEWITIIYKIKKRQKISAHIDNNSSATYGKLQVEETGVH